MGAAKDVYDEGALIFPAVKIQNDYEHEMDIVRMCQMRIRVPEQWWGDYLATLGAARVGEREILALGREVGWDLLDVYAREWFDYSEQTHDRGDPRPCRRAASRAAARTIRFPARPRTASTIKVTVEIKPDEAMIEVDLTRQSRLHGERHSTSRRPARRSAPMVGIFNSIDHTVPKNEGSFRRINVHLREAASSACRAHPTSCSVATTNIADRVANPVQCAIAELADGLGMAETGALHPALVRRRLRRPRRQALRQRGLSRLHRRRRHARPRTAG